VLFPNCVIVRARAVQVNWGSRIVFFLPFGRCFYGCAMTNPIRCDTANTSMSSQGEQEGEVP